jgi:hypothetical protein
MTEFHRVNYRNLTPKQQERRLNYLKRIEKLDVELHYLPSLDLLNEIKYLEEEKRKRLMRV